MAARSTPQKRNVPRSSSPFQRHKSEIFGFMAFQKNWSPRDGVDVSFWFPSAQPFHRVVKSATGVAQAGPAAAGLYRRLAIGEVCNNFETKFQRRFSYSSS